eukprot:11191452-Lingulodinium_polyedra.AAC.1
MKTQTETLISGPNFLLHERVVLSTAPRTSRVEDKPRRGIAARTSRAEDESTRGVAPRTSRAGTSR